MYEGSKINTLKGVGDKTASLFLKVGVSTVSDLLDYYPRTYDVYEDAILISEIEEGKVVTVTGTVFGRIQVGGSKNMQITSLLLKDISGTLKVVWYRMPFLRTTLSKGGMLTLRGKVTRKRNGMVMEQPEIFYPAHTYAEKKGTLQPVYPLTTGLTNNLVKKVMVQAMEFIKEDQEFLPEEFLEKYKLEGYEKSRRTIHFPENKESFIQARHRLVFEEFLIFVLSLRMQKEKEETYKNQFVFKEQPLIGEFIKKLPYELTGAQKKVWNEIQTDMSSEHMMSRLVQGDVGSGKTMVAFLAMLYASLNGYQSALMAPTEVLARQHFETITKLLSSYQLPLKAQLLTGSMTAKEKRECYSQIQTGSVDLIIGTHALIQEKVLYRNLALVITDEQHRFGVHQRESLAGKGSMPHILVMSATPIPRTLGIILYGDLDISIIDELPKNRLPIKNCVVDTGYRNTAYKFMESQIKQGRQCYVICSMVEESEHLEVENVTDYTEMLREYFPTSIKIACLHGKMKQQEKDELMEAFGRNEIQILVSTTVIEVGIDVPNATVMLIENAERFGLAQLHQLRGRVGRGKYQSYCIFMSAAKAKETKERLEILNKSNDGFFIASEDLRLRGPGDLFGIRQSGLMNFKLGDVFQDAKILKDASNAAEEIRKEDLMLTSNKYKNLATHLKKYMSGHLLEKTL